MCRLMGVNRNSYYSYQRRLQNKPIDPEYQEMLEWTKRISDSSQYSYGSRRIRKALNALGYPVGRKKTQRLMRESGVFVRYRKKYKVTTNSNHKKPLFKNVLNRQFTTCYPDQAYVSDITYGVPGAQGEYGHLNEPQIYLKYPVKAQGIIVH